MLLGLNSCNMIRTAFMREPDGLEEYVEIEAVNKYNMFDTFIVKGKVYNAHRRYTMRNITYRISLFDAKNNCIHKKLFETNQELSFGEMITFRHRFPDVDNVDYAKVQVVEAL